MGRRVRARWCLLGAGALLIATLVFPQAAAAAYTDNLVPTATYWAGCVKGSVGHANPCQTDNSTLTWWADNSGSNSVSSTDRSTISSVLESQYDSKTDLSVSYDSTPSFSGGAETDIVYQRGTVPGSDTGYTWCDDPVSSYKCDQQYVQIETGSFTFGLVCHESGHAVGLTHGSQASPVLPNDSSELDCMRKPSPSDQHLGSNSIENIDGVY